MAPLLASTLTSSRKQQSFLLLQSSTAQSCVPVLRHIVWCASRSTAESLLLFCLCYPPSALISTPDGERVKAFDWTSNVPGYDDLDVRKEILNNVRSAPSGPLDVVIDSADTLLSDLGSLARAEKFLSELLAVVRARSSPSRLVIHVLAPSPLIPTLVQTRFSATLSHVTAHPTALLTHIATAYLTLPPPLSPPEKFWSVFIPITERHHELEKLVFGTGGQGSGGSEFAVEVLVRGADGSGRRRGVERVLEGWSSSPSGGGPRELRDLESTKHLWERKTVEGSGPDPTQNLSFNLNLTPQQQQSRSQVPLPYAHDERPAEGTGGNRQPAAILYDPDSADDLDDDDPDEDLDL